jgi:hypothetical protein
LIVSADKGPSKYQSPFSTQYRSQTHPSITRELNPNASRSQTRSPADNDHGLGGRKRGNNGVFIGLGIGIPLFVIGLLLFIFVNRKDESVEECELESEVSSESTETLPSFADEDMPLTGSNEDTMVKAFSGSFEESSHAINF